MQMEGENGMNVEHVINEVVQICKKYSAKQVILFGSRAKGTALERSDIDIAVAGVHDFDCLLEEVEEIPTLYSIDLVDLDTCDNQLLLEDIEQYGCKIFEAL